MTRTRLFLAGSAAALGAMLALATPAAAQEVCEVNGGSTTAGTATTAGSLACGSGSVAGGPYANSFTTAVGINSQATGHYATAFGNYARALDTDGTAVGVNALSDGFGATAVGFSARALDASTTAVGAASLASAYGSTAIGWYAYATGLNSTSLGRYARAFGDYSVALGRLAIADGTNSVALGFEADNAGFANSVAIGAGTVNTEANQVHVGGRTVAGVADGEISATSTEAINGSQLFDLMGDVGSDIADLQAADVFLNNQITKANDRSASGTAVAIAMGGNAFLPDKRFNVTGNAGYYRGAWAGALNIGTLVGDSMAFNAGVGHGFNKRGKTGARAGFTFGW